MNYNDIPKTFGLYDSSFEHDSCGVGFICNINGKRDHDTVEKGIEILERLSHRGATGADPLTGDGAGITIQMPHEFFSDESIRLRINLPKKGDFAVGLVFLPKDKRDRLFCEDLFIKAITAEKQVFLGWRDVPLDNTGIGKGAKEAEPVIRHIFIGKGAGTSAGAEFERKLYVIRRVAENKVRASSIRQKSFFYIPSLSSATLSYKGLLTPSQVKPFFKDLSDKRIVSSLALVHSRYSTNTFPTWDLAQPFRYLAHNGEINTLRGNINWMHARESLLSSEVFGRDIKKLLPVMVPGGSDSAMLDNALELLVLSGRHIAHAMMMLVPIAWQQNSQIKQAHRDFYEYHSCLMEPWDGPAAIAFTDGRFIGGLLDRNGLRPCRYVITKDGKAVLASEVGVIDVLPENIKQNGRLLPGKVFLIDTAEGRVIEDEEIKDSFSQAAPYGKWVEENSVSLSGLKLPGNRQKEKDSDLLSVQRSFGYSKEDLKIILKPMAEKGQEPTGSMGNHNPLAMFSKKPRLLYDYFKQLFAQVTNPPIDPIREELVMSLSAFIGPQKNILSQTPEHASRLKVDHPVLTDDDLLRIKSISAKKFRTRTISTLFAPGKKGAFSSALKRICAESSAAIRNGYTFIVLSDRGVDKAHAALPALLAVSAVHSHLVRKMQRTQIGIVLESGEPREVMHFALLFGYGADCINPYAAFSSIRALSEEKELAVSEKDALKNYIKAVEKALLKILSKMGISTLQSYKGAQIFEALGVDGKVIDRYFPGTPSRIGGITLDTIEKETIQRHSDAFSGTDGGGLDVGGLYQWRRGGETHLWNPDTIHLLQQAARKNDAQRYAEFAKLINEQDGYLTTIRGALKIKNAGEPVPVDEVEPASEIVKRFVSGAMSFGSISKEAHETLAIAMNRLKGKSNSGEGGEDPKRFIPLANGDSVRSAIKQVASGRFGVTSNYLVNADELQIKMAQGAKPGEGGQLPGHKVDKKIAEIRYSTPGVTLISPPPHHDIYSIEDLAQLIFDLKNANPEARVSVKLVSEIGVGTIAAGVAKGHADMILISGGDGGTGASPISSIKHAGLPWELGLSETHQTLVLNDLRSRVRLQTDGQMRTGRDVAIAAMLGAEEYGFSTGLLITMGCVMLRHCHLNNCSVGVATQDENCRKRFEGRPDYIQNYLTFVAEELRSIMSGLGIRKLDELIGRADLLELDRSKLDWKSKGLDVSRVLFRPEGLDSSQIRCTMKQDHGLEKVMDTELLRSCEEAVAKRQKLSLELPVRNFDRTVGAMLSGRVSRLHGEDGLDEDTISIKLNGTAGQSFGAFLAKGLRLELEGDANDYVGKGLSGGKIVIYPNRGSTFEPESNIIIGNTTFYGATAGDAYICGVAGERFCIRNSGAYAVVEGVGDHGCEYMTGGRVIILGKTGVNFGAGMSGGIAFVYDIDGKFSTRCNTSMVDIEPLTERDKDFVREMILKHLKHTRSDNARRILDRYDREARKFLKVMPKEYKRVLAAMEAVKAEEEPSDG